MSKGLEAFESLDRAVTVEIRRGNAPQGFVKHLYEAARGRTPISYEIGQALCELEPGPIAIVTGIVHPEFFPHGEIDGPVGAFTLGRALRHLGLQPVYFLERPLAAVIEALGHAADFFDYHVEVVAEMSPPLAVETWAQRCVAGIAIEALGQNLVGTRHFVTGRAYGNPLAGYGEELMRELTAMGKLTIGIGDGGNEIGFGSLRGAVLEAVPYARSCRCPCGGGIAAATPTARMFPAAISNWGAYAVVNALALLSGQPDLIHTPETEEVLLLAASAVGCRDGVTLRPEPRQDGINLRGCKAMIEILACIVGESNLDYNRPI